MSSSLRLRRLTRLDLSFAESLSALAGWNQTRADWERLLALEPQGCFLAEWDGVAAGTATTTVYGPHLAWIGMVLVHPDYRRRGVGRALLEACVEHLRGRGIGCLKLDATPEGKPVYERLGFLEEGTLTRWQRESGSTGRSEMAPGVCPWPGAGLTAVEALDTAAFGVSRRRLLERLGEQSLGGFVQEMEPGRLAGYGLLRPGARADYLGPVVAETAAVAEGLLQALLARAIGPLFWDIPDANAAAVAWARSRRFTPLRMLTRMALGNRLTPGVPHRQFAIAGPEYG